MLEPGLLLGPGSHLWGTRGIRVHICMQAAEPDGTGFELQVTGKDSTAGRLHEFSPFGECT